MANVLITAIKFAIVIQPLVLAVYAIGGFARLSLIGG